MTFKNFRAKIEPRDFGWRLTLGPLVEDFPTTIALLDTLMRALRAVDRERHEILMKRGVQNILSGKK